MPPKDGAYTGSLGPVWYCTDFGFFDEKQRTAAKRPGIERGTDEINQSRYFKNALTFKKKSKIVFVKWK